MFILDRIIANKKQEIQLQKSLNPIQDLKAEIRDSESEKISMLKKINSDDRFHFICEIKKASPSKGIIQDNFNPVKQAKMYLEGGASAISVLTDEKYFLGHSDDLRQVKTVSNIPVLRKDFIVDEYQIYQSKAMKADIILLIAKVLDKKQISNFCQIADELELDVLFEISGADEIEKIPADIPVIVGINNRNLDTFEVDLSKSFDLKKLLPENLSVIAESGISSPEECRSLFNAGLRGALIGESLIKNDNPEKLLKSFIKQANHENPT